MAMQSFYQDIILKTREEVEILEATFEEADHRGPIDISGTRKVIDNSEMIDRILRIVKR